MNTVLVVQPGNELGDMLLDLFEKDQEKIYVVSAFVSLATIQRLREVVDTAVKKHTSVTFVVGIDHDGTSKEVLEEFLTWNCTVFVFHNTYPVSTFHPKVYIFRNKTEATIIIGSNNLTDGGWYSNYEAATRIDFVLPEDEKKFSDAFGMLKCFIHPEKKDLSQRLTRELLDKLCNNNDGIVSDEKTIAEKRNHQKSENKKTTRSSFPYVKTKRPERASQKSITLPSKNRDYGIVVWKKVLSQTDALQTSGNTHSVGGVRLTQAKFEVEGKRIDQTKYFRKLFSMYPWSTEPAKHSDQEHAFVPMHIIIDGDALGQREFEISHKPSGEAGQGNYTTQLRWRDLSGEISRRKLTGKLFTLYKNSHDDFTIVVSNG